MIIIVKNSACGNYHINFNSKYSIDSENEISFRNKSSGYDKHWRITQDKSYEHNSSGSAKGYHSIEHGIYEIEANKIHQNLHLY